MEVPELKARRVKKDGYCEIETQDEVFLFVFHNVVVSAFKFGSSRRFFGVDTANFVWWYAGHPSSCRIPVPCLICYIEKAQQVT